MSVYTTDAANLKIFDTDALSVELSVEARAAQAGRRGEPNETETTLDEPQQAIVSTIREQLADLRKVCGAALTRLEARRNEIRIENAFAQLNSTRDSVGINVQRVLDNRRDALIEARTSFVIEEQSLRYFKRSHHIHREAHYPASPVLHWSIMAVIVLIESIMNSYFFSLASDLGLVGGLLQAIIISVVNVFMAALVGAFPARWLHHTSLQLRMAGAGLLIFFLGICIAFNLAVAQYRALLESDPLNALQSVLAVMRTTPFQLDNFDSIILFLMGFLIAIAAVIKTYKADDPYPGFGAMDRRRNEAKEYYDDMKAELRIETDQAVDSCRKDAISTLGTARQWISEYDKNILSSRAIESDFSASSEDAGHAQKELLSLYRSVNSEIRVDPPPAYFASYPEVVGREPLDLSNLATAEEMLGRLRSSLGDLEDQGINVLSMFKELNDKAQESVQAFFDEIDREAKQNAQLALSDGPGRV